MGSEAIRSLRRLAPVLVVWGVVAFLLMGLGSAVFRALRLGLDEDFELTKGLLWAQGIPLYDSLWNDQPPLLTVLLGALFQVFGPDIAVARSAALGFGLALLAGMTVAVNRQAGPLAAALATFSLLSAPGVLFLALSVMLEVPAIGVALWARWPIQRWHDAANTLRRRGEARSGAGPIAAGTTSEHRLFREPGVRLSVWLWPVFSGLLLAIALQIKPTAAVVLPALVVEWWLGHAERRHTHGFHQRLGALGLWGATVVGCYLGIAALAGHVPPEVLWRTHFSAAVRAAANEPQFAFPRVLLGHEYVDTLVCAGVALGVLVWRRQWQMLRFPMVWLLTAAGVHVLHRPWWMIYFLHFAVPLAWLIGSGTAAMFLEAGRFLGDGRWSKRCWGGVWLGAAAMLLSALITYGTERLWAVTVKIRHLPRVEESGLVAEMRRYAGWTRWIYTRETIYAFHAGLPVIPELAVLPTKRFWSGEITWEQIEQTVMRYRPEQLLLSGEPFTLAVRHFIERDYEAVYQEGAYLLFVRKPPTAAEP